LRQQTQITEFSSAFLRGSLFHQTKEKDKCTGATACLIWSRSCCSWVWHYTASRRSEPEDRAIWRQNSARAPETRRITLPVLRDSTSSDRDEGLFHGRHHRSGASIVSSFSWRIALRPNGSTANFAQQATIKDTLIPCRGALHHPAHRRREDNDTDDHREQIQGRRWGRTGSLPRLVPKAGCLEPVEDERSRDNAETGTLRNAGSRTQPTRVIPSVPTAPLHKVPHDRLGSDGKNNGNFGYLAHKANGATADGTRRG